MSSSGSKSPFGDGAEEFLLEPNIPILKDLPPAPERSRAPEPEPEQEPEPEPKHAPKKAKPKKKGVRYIPALDGLRALAVLAVIAYHTGLPGCDGGLMGVTVFFVISGYIITKILLVEFARTGRISFKDFYIRRVKRLIPLIVLVIAATGALCTLFNHVLLTKMRPEVIPSLLFVNNWWQILNDASYFENIGLPSPLTHFWSLAIEEQFYLVLPFTLFCVLRFSRKLRQRRNLSLMLLILAALSAIEMTLLYDPTQDPTRVYYGTDTRAFSLLMGAVIAVLTTGSAAKIPKAVREACAIIGLIGVLACLAFMSGEASFTYQGGMVICSALTALLIFGTIAKEGGLIASILSWKPFIWIGKRSYGLYLWHYPLVLLFTPMNGAFGMDWLYMACAIACTFICATLSYKYVENPIRYGIAKAKEAQVEQAPSEQATPAAADGLPIVEGLISPAMAEAASFRPERALPEGPTPEEPSAVKRAWTKLRELIPLKAIPAAVAAILIVVCLGGLIFVKDTSALSHDGAAIIIRDSLAGEPLTGEVKLASGDEEIQIIGLPEEEEEEAEEKPVYDVLMIGDSVALRAVPDFEERFPFGHIDAERNRQLSQGITAYQQYEDDGQVGDIVIFALGTNGPLTEEELHEAIEAVGPDKQIYFVTNRSDNAELNAENNRMLNVVREQYDNVRLIDWNALTEMHGDYFDGDGTHLTPEGAEVYIQFIADVLQYPTADEQRAQHEEVESDTE